MASEMPSADDELDLDNCSNPPRVDRPAPTSVMAPSTGGAAAVAVSSVEKIDEDPLKFLENHGFTSEQLYHHGIISLRADDRSISSRNMPLNLIDKLSSEMIQHPAPSSTVSGVVSDASLGIRGSVPETFAIAPPTSSDVATAPSSSVPEAVNRRKLSSVVGPEYGNVSDVSHWSSDQNTSSDVAGSMFDLHQRRTSNSTVPTTAKSFQSFSLPDVVYVSDQIISNLRTGLEIPPTLTFPRMAMEVHEAISALAQLTAPSTQDSKDSEYLDPRLTEKAGEMTQNARDQISEASIRLVDRIRYMLQSSCQLDTGVISMLNESSTATSFMSPSFKFQRLSTNSSSTDSSMGLVSHSRSGSLNGSFSGQTNSAYPDLKHSTRKIASTLSKLTLSTRALWGMFSTLLLEVPPRADGRERSDDYDDNDDSRLQVEANRRYNAQTRFTLEQKLRSECKVGVGDLTTNVDNFIHQFDKILRERVSSQLDPSPLLHFPRHGRGYLSVPIQYTFLPGGAKGGNWKSSGFDKLLSPTPHSSSSEYGTGPMGGKNSPRSSMGNSRSNKLTLEWFSKRLFPSIRKVIDSSRFIFGALSQGNGNEFGDDATVYVGFVSPTTVKPPGRLDENTSDALLVEVLDLIDLSGSILSAAESLDIASSLEIDLDPYILHDLNHNAQTKDSTMQETLALVTNQLRSARYLVAEFQRSKQKLYEVNAKLIMTTQMLLTSGGSFLTPTTNSPAQQPFASPLFSHNPPTIPNEGTQKILQVLELFYSSFESFGSATQSLAQEAERQSAQELSLSSFNQTVRTGISLRKFGSGSNDLGILNLYRNSMWSPLSLSL
ncbi:hypothetical protein BY996DRAFT_2585164 [Phakopsora pachyrhizi]|nr:hypothetical protein BY996DRAFT_2585164 [Phakopsora pachyrhizi]